MDAGRVQTHQLGQACSRGGISQHGCSVAVTLELYAHSAVARDAGVPEAAIQALVSGKSSEDLSPEEQVAHRFARQLATEHDVDADLYREAESMFGRTGLVDMVYLIGMYLLTSALLNAFKIPAPE
jgi:4-carboxymuconolactone decarboxylase